MTDIVCPACAAVNRVPPEKPAEAARCGKSMPGSDCSHSTRPGMNSIT